MSSIDIPNPGSAATTRPAARIRSAMVEPAEDARLDRVPLWAGYVLALVAPLAVALLLIPFRESLEQGAALVMILPVVAVALVAGTGPAVLAAVSAGASFAVFLTVPYGELAIHQNADVVATIVLLVVAVVVGVTAVRQHRFERRAELRRDELERVLAFAEASATEPDPAALIALATEHLTAILRLESCEWHTGPMPTGGPVVLDDGQVMGYLSELPPDRRQLPPTGIALGARTATAPVGWFQLVPEAGSTTSIEQRRTSAALADLLAVALARGSASRPEIPAT